MGERGGVEVGVDVGSYDRLRVLLLLLLMLLLRAGGGRRSCVAGEEVEAEEVVGLVAFCSGVLGFRKGILSLRSIFASKGSEMRFFESVLGCSWGSVRGGAGRWEVESEPPEGARWCSLVL